jgi:hypothetical protein
MASSFFNSSCPVPIMAYFAKASPPFVRPLSDTELFPIVYICGQELHNEQTAFLTAFLHKNGL